MKPLSTSLSTNGLRLRNRSASYNVRFGLPIQADVA
jgi:hypothetical protein